MHGVVYWGGKCPRSRRVKRRRGSSPCIRVQGRCKGGGQGRKGGREYNPGGEEKGKQKKKGKEKNNPGWQMM